MLKVITFNAAILDVRIFGRSFHCAVEHIDDRLEALARALERTGADLVFLQEVFHRDKQDRLCSLVQEHYPYIHGHAPAGWKLRLGNELLTLSRLPLQDYGLTRFRCAPREELRHTSKGFYHMQFTLPGAGEIHLVNFHMSAGGKNQHPESVKMERIREQQIAQLVDYCKNYELVLLAGDLNAGTHSSSKNYQDLLSAGFVDLFESHGAEGITWDPENPLVKSGVEAHLPAQRIDHILVNKTLFNKLNVLNADIIFTEHIVTTTEGPRPISDHYGLFVEIDSSPEH